MSFATTIVGHVERHLAAHGYRRQRGSVGKTTSPDSRVNIGLSDRTYPSRLVTMFVSIGVRFDSVYELGAELGAYPESKTMANLSIALQYLVPGENADYRFLPDEHAANEQEVRRLVADITAFGVPKFEALTTASKAVEAIERNLIPSINGVSYFVPLAHMLADNYVAARQVCEQNLSRMDVSRGTGRRYAAFAERLIKLTESG